MGKDGRQLIVIALLPVLCALAFARCGNPLVLQIVEPKTVRFDSNGGTDIASQTLYKNQTIKPPSDPSKSGHEFEGWFRDNETFEAAWDFKTVPVKNITLYAKWEALPITDTFTVTFDKNGGDTDADPSSRIVVYGGLVTAPEIEPAREYFEFLGWYREENCVTPWDFAVDTVTEDLTLYARWEISPTAGSAGITLSVAQIEEGAPVIAGVTISRAGPNPPVTLNVTVPNPGDYTSIGWEIAGTGAYRGETVTGIGAVFQLDGKDEKYNTIGGHVLKLIVVKGGVTYQANINFTVEP